MKANHKHDYHEVIANVSDGKGSYIGEKIRAARCTICGRFKNLHFIEYADVENCGFHLLLSSKDLVKKYPNLPHVTVTKKQLLNKE